jgi:predicted porin
VRFGAEYLFIRTAGTTAVRAGLFSDPEPGTGYVNKFQGFSLGAGYTTKQYSLDASYQYRSGKDVDGDIAAIEPKSTDVNQRTMMISVIYYF